MVFKKSQSILTLATRSRGYTDKTHLFLWMPLFGNMELPSLLEVELIDL